MKTRIFFHGLMYLHSCSLLRLPGCAMLHVCSHTEPYSLRRGACSLTPARGFIVGVIWLPFSLWWAMRSPYLVLTLFFWC
jgi:hypothetical protein